MMFQFLLRKCLPQFRRFLIYVSVGAIALRCVHSVDRAGGVRRARFRALVAVFEFDTLVYGHVVSVFLAVGVLLAVPVLDLESVGIRAVRASVVVGLALYVVTVLRALASPHRLHPVRLRLW